MAQVDLGAAKRGVKGKKAPDGAAKVTLRDIPNSKLYAELRELDLKIEQYSNRKKAEICDLSHALDLQLRCLRLQLYNRHQNQGSTDPARPPSWSFYIYGSFVDHNQGTSTSAAGTSGASAPALAAPVPAHVAVQPPPAAKPTVDRNWTLAMSSVQLRIEHPDAPDMAPEVVRWERNRHVGQHKESIEVHRVGAMPARIYVTMVRDYAPEYFRVDGALASALNMTGGSRGVILRKLRAHVQAHSEPDPADPSFVTPDDELRALLNVDRLEMNQLNDFVDAFLEPLPPVALEYTIQLAGPSPSASSCYDVEVAWSLRPIMLKMPPILERLNVTAALEQQDAKVAEALAALKQAQRKRRFLMGFAMHPADFVRKFVAASAKDVREQQGAAGELAAAEHFSRPWAQEAAVHYLELVEKRNSAQPLAA